MKIHLALNHIPVIGLPLLLILLVAGCWQKSNQLIRSALWSLLVMTAVAIAIKFTGDFAAEESGARLDAAQNFVVRHEQAGDQVTTAVFIFGLLVAMALWLARSDRRIPRWTLVLVISAGLLTCLLYARSANTGGQISHPELR